MQYTWQLALGASPSCSCLYISKHSHIYYKHCYNYNYVKLLSAANIINDFTYISVISRTCTELLSTLQTRKCS